MGASYRAEFHPKARVPDCMTPTVQGRHFTPFPPHPLPPEILQAHNKPYSYQTFNNMV